jgi:cytochrome c oxidase assembly protein subunit 15
MSKSSFEASGGPNVGLHRFSILLACATLILLIAGALVTSNDAGDSVPDWPMSFGRWLPGSNQFVANVRYEYSHRLIAATVAIITLILALWAWLAASVRKQIKWLVAAALAGVVLQALIGGLRVLLPAYKAEIAIPHALVAQGFFCAAMSLVVLTSRSWNMPREVKLDARRFSTRRLTVIAVASVFIQLVLGAGFRHGAFGIMPHIIGAATVTVFIGWVAIRILRFHATDVYLRRPALAACALLLVQLGLGVATYIARLASRNDPQPMEPVISLTVAHLTIGALVLAAALVLALRCHQVLAPRVASSSSDEAERKRPNIRLVSDKSSTARGAGAQ